jgi:hypothetical protein
LERSRIASTFEIHSATLEAMFVYRTFIVVVPWTGMVDSLEKGAMGVGGDGIKSDMITGGGRQEGGGRRSGESLKRRRMTSKKVSPRKYIVGVTTKEGQNYLKKRR